MTKSANASERSLLRVRPLAVMVLGVMIPLAVAFGFLVFIAMNVSIENQSALAEETFSAVGDLGCRDVGEAKFSVQTPSMQLFGYDGETLKSQNPSAPALPEKIGVALRTGRSSMAQIIPLVGGNVAVRVRPQGSCSVLAFSWTATRYRGMWLLLFAGYVTTALATLVVGVSFVVKPLRVRIERVARLAVQVGNGLDWTLFRRNDDLGVIESSLLEADARLVEQKRELAAKNAALEKFLLELGHDMKSPLASLALAADELRSLQANDTLESTQRIAAEVIYLEQLIENLRLETRYAHGLVLRQEIDVNLNEVVESVSARLKLYAKRIGVALNYAVPETSYFVRGDEALLIRALANLVHNATSHGAQNVAVELRRNESGVGIFIADDGPGITGERLSDLGRKTPEPSPFLGRRGEGLGMTIARKVLDGHGASLAFANIEEGEGLVATIAWSSTSVRASEEPAD